MLDVMSLACLRLAIRAARQGGRREFALHGRAVLVVIGRAEHGEVVRYCKVKYCLSFQLRGKARTLQGRGRLKEK